jgi:methylenetetrahydrofolate reductase (NADPH)
MSTGFSFEILPPLKGNSIYNIYDIIDSLREFEPEHINITAHHSEVIYKELPDGNLRRVSVKKRPGTVAIAAAIQNKYGITAVPPTCACCAVTPKVPKQSNKTRRSFTNTPPTSKNK